MSTYKEIFGKPIKVVSSDPTDAGAEGQVWYNSTLGSFRSVVAGGAWASDSSLVTARQATSAAGNMSAMFAAGGSNEPAVATNEHYNGSGWSSAEALPAGRAGSGQAFGTQTAGVYFCGTSADPATRNNDTYEYDGTNWTGGGAYPTSLNNLGSSGTLTAGLGFGGDPVSAVTAEYNGTSWTAGGSLNTGRAGVAFSSAGTQTASLCAGGYNNPPGPRTNVEAYNGTAWTEVNDLPVARSSTTGAGTETNTIVIGGEIAPGITNTCVQYDGTNWAAIPSMATARFQTGTAGPGTGALAISGSGPGLIPTNEQYNFTANTVTTAAWASGGALGTARYQLGGAGDLPAGLAYGGYSAGNQNKTEEYNGTSWSEVNDMANPRGQCSGQHIGTQTSALAAGGTLPGSPNYGALCEEYDGTNWTTGGALTEDGGRAYLAGFGTQTAGVAGGGYAQTGATANSEHYDGSSWTAANNMNTARYDASGTGTQTAGLAVGQYPGTGTVEEYNGTNWTSVTSYPAGRFGIYGGMGTQTDCIYAGGSASSTRTTETFGYDGTSWSSRPSLGNALSSGASGGTSSSAFIAGGRGSPPGPTAGVTTTEEFTGETTALNYKTVSSS